MKNENVLQLDPAKVQADDNIRFGLLPHRVDAMAESIVERGGVQSPVFVAKLDKPANGYTHRLIAGFYRHAAALKLNTDSKAGLTLPALLKEEGDAADRLKAQASENLDRENLSPMDKAVAMRKMMNAGFSRADVCKLFAVVGGRKGVQMQPLSNSALNIHLAFLDLPKSIQSKIHDGRIGVAAAYELGKVPADQREAVIEKAEALRLKLIDREEKDDAKLAKSEETEAEKQARLDKADADLKAAQQAEADAIEILNRARAAEAEAKAKGEGKNFLDIPADEKQAIAKEVGAAKAGVRAADKILSKAKKDLSKVQTTYNKVVGKGEAEGEAVEEPKAKAGASKKAAVGPQDVKKAAKALGTKGSGPVALSASEARAAAGEIAKSKFSKAKRIGELLAKVLSGEMAPASARTDIEVLTGERKTSKA